MHGQKWLFIYISFNKCLSRLWWHMLLVCFNPYKDFCDLINYVVWRFGLVASRISNPEGYVWFPSNLKENVRERK